MNEKTLKKDIKGPDEFITITQKAVNWIIGQKVSLAIGSGAIAVVVLGVFGWRWYSDSMEQNASREFIKAKESLNARVVPKEGLENTSLADGTFATQEDKYRAALASFETVKSNHPSARVARLATYFIGECHQKIAEHEKAIQAFRDYLAEEGPSGDLAIFAQEGIAASLEEQNKLEEAAKEYQKLTEAPLNREPDRGLYHLARLEQKTGKLMEAIKHYNEVLEKHPKTSFRQEIQSRLDGLPKSAEKQTQPMPDPAVPAKPPEKTASQGAE